MLERILERLLRWLGIELDYDLERIHEARLLTDPRRLDPRSRTLEEAARDREHPKSEPDTED